MTIQRGFAPHSTVARFATRVALPRVAAPLKKKVRVVNPKVCPKTGYDLAGVAGERVAGVAAGQLWRLWLLGLKGFYEKVAGRLLRCLVPKKSRKKRLRRLSRIVEGLAKNIAGVMP